MTFLSSFVNLFVGLRPLHVLCLLMLTGVVAAQTDRFGGNLVIRRNASGFFRVEQVTGKPILVIDWAAPFSLGEAFDSEHGHIKAEAESALDSAKWLTAALAHPGIVGVFRCQLIGTHGNDHWFEGKAKRTYLRDDGTPFPSMAARVSAANREALKAAYDKAAAR